MKVGELIKELQKYDKNIPVIVDSDHVYDDNGDHTDYPEVLYITCKDNQLMLGITWKEIDEEIE